MMLKAYWSGMKFFPEMWRSRRKIRRFARLTNRDFVNLIRRHRISTGSLRRKLNPGQSAFLIHGSVPGAPGLFDPAFLRVVEFAGVA